MTHVVPGYTRITCDPEILGGQPCVRGMRLSVQRVLEVLAQYPEWDELRQDYPDQMGESGLPKYLPPAPAWCIREMRDGTLCGPPVSSTLSSLLSQDASTKNLISYAPELEPTCPQIAGISVSGSPRTTNAT